MTTVEGIEEPAVEVAVEVPVRLVVGRAGGSGDDGREVQRDADRDVGRRAERGDRPAVREEDVVAGEEPRLPVAEARRVAADLVSEEARAPRLVVRDPVLHAIAEAFPHHLRVLGEGLGGRARRPAPFVLERLGEIPVVERDVRLDPRFEEGVDERRVEVETAGVHLAAAGRQDARPRDGEAVRLDTEALHERDVVAEAMVVIAGARAARAVLDRTGHAREAVPDGLPPAVVLRRPLDLVGGGRGAPHEARGEVGSAHDRSVGSGLWRGALGSAGGDADARSRRAWARGVVAGAPRGGAQKRAARREPRFPRFVEP